MEPNIFIFEDNPNIAMDLAKYLEKLGYTEIKVTSNFNAAKKQIKNNFPDIALLDIHSSEDDEAGIKLAKMIKNIKTIPVIYVTAYPEKYKNKALSTSPEAYLPKGFYEKILDSTIYLALERLSKVQGFKDQRKDLIPFNDRFFMKKGKSYSKVEKDSIFYVKSNSDYIEVYTKNERYSSTVLLKDFHVQLRDERFQRLHRSFLVNINHIDKVNLDKKFVLVNETKIPVGQNGADFLSKMLPRIYTKRNFS